MESNTEAVVDSTPTDDSIAEVPQGRTEQDLLADVLKQSQFVQDPLPKEQEVPEIDPEESEQDPESEEAVNEEVEEEDESDVGEEEGEDADEESATEEPETYSMDDLDLEAKVVVKIDGEDAEVSFSDLIKGYSTEQHLSKKGRELGEARKELEDEYTSKVEELSAMSKASVAILYSNEQDFAKKYHDIEAKIEKAREEGDSFEMNNLKDEREQVQKKYWDARNQREQLVESAEKQSQEQEAKMWSDQIEYFNETIPTLIPDFSEDTAAAIRQFALDEGIHPDVLDAIADPQIVKFVDDYRRLKNGVEKGKAKRKAVTVKKAPVRKAKTNKQRQQQQNETVRSRAMSPDSSKEDQMAYLRTLAERSLNQI